jgi:hypothetical protein
MICRKPGCLCPLSKDEECCPDCLTPNPGYKRTVTNAVIQGQNAPEITKESIKKLFDEGWVLIDTNTLGVDLDCCEMIENMEQLEEAIKDEA